MKPLLILVLALTSCTSNPEANAMIREAAVAAIAEYQRQHPVYPDK